MEQMIEEYAGGILLLFVGGSILYAFGIMMSCI